MQKFVAVFVLLGALFSQTGLLGQNLDKYYSRRVQEGGDIFFVFPNENFSNTENHSDFIFDITMMEDHDSATINFTYYTPEPEPARQLVILSGNDEISAPAKKLYVDFVKKKWENRFGATVGFDDLMKAVDSEKPPKFKVITAKNEYTFQTKNRKWEKYAGALDKIFYMVHSEKFE